MHRSLAYISLVVLGSSLALAQITTQQSPPTARATVPRLVRFSGIAQDSAGKPLSGVLGVTFSLYQAQSGGAAAWIETQNVKVDAAGRYSARLGASKPDGLPTDVFTSGEAKWLSVQMEGGKEQPRVLLLSVPYALKAADAETVGGKPASAFALAAPLSAKPSSARATAQNTLTTLSVSGSGSINHLPVWTTSSNLGSSTISQDPTTKNIGIGTSTPTAKLDVNGGAFIRGALKSAGNGLNVVLGNVGCSSPTWGIGAAGVNCNTFFLGYNSAQPGTYINRPTGGAIHFRENNGADQMTINPGGGVSIAAGLRIQPATDSFGSPTVNIIGGFSGNTVASGFGGQTIAGGGSFVWCATGGTGCGSLGTNSFVVSVLGPSTSSMALVAQVAI